MPANAVAPAKASSRPSLPPALMAPLRWWRLGKYRDIVIAVAFFLLFDLGVLVLNFYTSFQIGQDAVGINLAGRQRMLSQRSAKALLAYEASQARQEPGLAELEELRGAVKLFDVSLGGFQNGAIVPGGDGKPVALAAAEGLRATDILDKARALWLPYQQLLTPVLAERATPEQLGQAVAYAKANNLKLLGLMNELTTALESVAAERASTLRRVQTGGIALALLNFAFILFKFVRRLRLSDAAVEVANEENREILASVREGLFLITPDHRLGTQMSQSAQQLFGDALKPGADFFAVLLPLVSADDLDAAHSYVDLLFQPHVKESLVQSINPLSEVALTRKNHLGQDVQHHFSFQFNRAMVDGVVRHLLVVVQDVSERVTLSHRLEQDRERARNEFAMLLAAFSTDPATLRQFVQRAEAGLLEVNDWLRSTASAPNEASILRALDNAGRRVHAFKGDASMLGLDSLAEMAHQFESGLQRIRQSGGSASALGDALLGLPSVLENLLNKVGALKNMARNAPATSPTTAGEADSGALNQAMTRLIDQVASDQGKHVQPQVRLGCLHDLEPEPQHLLREITVQLVRNAITHGLGTPAERQAAGKASEGRLDVVLNATPNGGWLLRVRDDGQGISADKVRTRLRELGWYTEAQLANFSERQLVEKIFKPGFSTAPGVSLHAGRGTGLDVVVANVQRLGAHLRLSSTPGEFTEFQVQVAG